MLRKLFDRVAAVHEYAVITVYIGYFASTTRGCSEAGIVGEYVPLGVQLCYVQDTWSDRRDVLWKFYFGIRF